MERTASAQKVTHPTEPKHFDWFVGLLYVVGAVGFGAIIALFVLLFTGQPTL